MKTDVRFVWIGFAILAVMMAGCAGIDAGGNIHKDGRNFSGTFAVVKLPGNIPYIPASNGKGARLSQIEIDQILYLDASCQQQLFEQLPGWAQAIVKEGGWSALVVAVGEYGFASAFPGVELVRYFLGGLGYGSAAGINTARIRQDGSEKAAQGYCVLLQVWELKKRYHALEGVSIIPWYGDGHVAAPKATDKTSTPTLSHVDVGNGPLPK